MITVWTLERKVGRRVYKFSLIFDVKHGLFYAYIQANKSFINFLVEEEKMRQLKEAIERCL